MRVPYIAALPISFAYYTSCHELEGTLQQILAIQNREEPLPAGEVRCVRHDWWIERGRAPCGEHGRHRRALRCRHCLAVTCRECRDRADAFGLLGM